jgi:iron complex transport system substrate-binding protein
MQSGHVARRMALALLLGTAALPAFADPLTVQDDRGRTLVLERPATRVISLAPNTTELMYAIGAESALIAVTELSDYPSAARTLPSVGGLNGLDLERIVALKPDLVIAWASGNSRTELDALEKAGVVVFESDPSTVEGVSKTLAKLGILTGHASQGTRAADGLLSGFDAIAKREHGKPPVTVFYEVWDPPLITLGGPQLITSIINACGGQNIFADLSVLAPTVDPEAVIARHPDVIVADPGERDNVANTWRQRAGHDGRWRPRVVGIDPDLLIRAGPRIVAGTVALCDALDAARSASASAATVMPK